MENVSPHKRVKESLRLGCARVGMIFSVVQLDEEYASPSFNCFFLIPLLFPPNPAPHILLPSFLDIFARVGGLEEKRLLFRTFRNFFVVKILKDGAGSARFFFLGNYGRYDNKIDMGNNREICTSLAEFHWEAGCVTCS